MTEQQRLWAGARDRLVLAVRTLGYPDELADLMAKQLKSPKAIDRMTAYIEHVRPRSMEMLADEMLAICADRDTRRERIISREAQEAYNARLFERRMTDGGDDDRGA